jgi:hypothetical protein
MRASWASNYSNGPLAAFSQVHLAASFVIDSFLRNATSAVINVPLARKSAATPTTVQPTDGTVTIGDCGSVRACNPV